MAGRPARAQAEGGDPIHLVDPAQQWAIGDAGDGDPAQGVADELVILVDQRCTHGNFRNWAKFTHHVLRLCEAAGRERIDEEIVRNVFRFLGGGVAGG